ncbi:hypothetical protein A0H81_08594 [Grifola frondosa]|uniref:Uncharacterized protein n=1 Tax=Grifola frondosa TaxID=5627 RepID=A0A1C7M319_GRIFR|nr:hypothetical protein A0H81_08594 [Grifola frondosa]
MELEPKSAASPALIRCSERLQSSQPSKSGRSTLCLCQIHTYLESALTRREAIAFDIADNPVEVRRREKVMKAPARAPRAHAPRREILLRRLHHLAQDAHSNHVPSVFSSLVLIDPAILPYPAARRLGIQEERARHVPHDTVLRG